MEEGLESRPDDMEDDVGRERFRRYRFEPWFSTLGPCIPYTGLIEHWLQEKKVTRPRISQS